MSYNFKRWKTYGKSHTGLDNEVSISKLQISIAHNLVEEHFSPGDRVELLYDSDAQVVAITPKSLNTDSRGYKLSKPAKGQGTSWRLNPHSFIRHLKFRFQRYPAEWNRAIGGIVFHYEVEEDRQ